MSPTVSARHAWLSALEEELLRAREFEVAGKEHLNAQEKRVANFKAKNLHRPLSERLLDLLRDADKLHADHVRLLEREVREAVDPKSVMYILGRRLHNAGWPLKTGD